MTHVQKNITKFYSKLNKFRTIEKYSDYTVVCEQTSFRCHRLVLAAACPYFDSMFSLQLKERDADFAVLPEIKAATFQKVLQFIYTGDTFINSDNIFSVIVASDFLHLDGLEELCIQYLKEGLACMSILDMLSFAYATNKRSLANVLVDQVVKCLRLFLKSKEFLEVPFQFLREILMHPKCVQEFELVSPSLENALIRWIEYSRKERLQYLNQIRELFQFKNVFLIESLTSADECVKLTHKCEIISYDGVVSKNEISPSLNVFIGHYTVLDEYNDEPEGNCVDVFELDENHGCFAMCEIPQRENGDHEMKCVSTNDSYLYCLNYWYYWDDDIEEKIIFSVSNSVDGQSKTILKPPPETSVLFKICNMQDSILFYNKLIDDSYRNSIYQYNKVLDEWFPVPKMDEKRKNADLTVCNDTHLVYMIGGTAPTDVIPINFVQAYDYRTQKWQKLPQTIYNRCRAASCLYKGKVYVSGGMNNTCEVYDPVAGKWEEIAPLIEETKDHQIVPYENTLWVVGGLRSYKVNFDIDKYDPILNKWCSSSILGKKYRGVFASVLDCVVFKSYSSIHYQFEDEEML